MFKYLFTIVMSAIFSILPAITFAAQISLSPSSGSYTVGDTFSVDVLLDTQGQSVDGVDIHYLKYNPAVVELQDADSTQSGVQISIGNLMPNTVRNLATIAGAIDFAQITAGGNTFISSIGGDVLATLTFRVLQQGISALTFDFTPGNTTDVNVASNSFDILASASGATYTLAASSGNGGSTIPSPSGGSGGGSSGGGGGGGYTIPPAPSNFIVYGGPDQVVLTWDNPISSNFVRARIIRKIGSPPTTPSDGTLIYEGDNEEFTDTDVLPGVAYYYAIYSIDRTLRASPLRQTGTTVQLGDLSEQEIVTLVSSKQTTAPTVTQSFSYYFTLPLQVGSSGEEVRQLQTFLNLLGFSIASTGPGSPGNESTYFGPLTKDAVSRFQAQYIPTISLASRGLVGPITRSTLNNIAGGGGGVTITPIPPLIPPITPPVTPTPVPTLPVTAYTFTRNLRVGVRGDDVLQLQKFLNARGFTLASTGPGAPGEETTYFGPLTKAGIIRLQEAYNTEILVAVGIFTGKGTGFFGPSTIKQVHALMASGGTTPQTTTQYLQQQIQSAERQIQILLQQIEALP